MTNYEIRTINWSNIKNTEDYSTELEKSIVKKCKGLKEVEAYCGCKLRRQRCGYSGMIGNTEYIVTRC